MDLPVAKAVAHAAEAPLWYALDLSAGGAEVNTLELLIKSDSTPWGHRELGVTLVQGYGEPTDSGRPTYRRTIGR